MPNMHTSRLSTNKQQLSLSNPTFVLYGISSQVGLVAGLISLVLYCYNGHVQPVVVLCQAMPPLLTICVNSTQVHSMCSDGLNLVSNDKVLTILGLNLVLSAASVVAPLEHDRNTNILVVQMISLVGFFFAGIFYGFTIKGCRKGSGGPSCHSSFMVNVPAPALGGFVPLVQTPLPSYSELVYEEACLPPTYSEACLNVESNESQAATGTTPPPSYTLQVE